MFRTTLTVQSWTVALERLHGRPTKVLPPGRHRVPIRAEHQVIDLRERRETMAFQEVPTADAVTIKVSATYRWRVSDPVTFAETSQDPGSELYTQVQLALRAAVAPIGLDQVTSLPGSAVLREQVSAAVQRLGIEVLAVEVRDVVLPAELRAARADLVIGRHRAQALLEEARAETAALRSLANGAKVLAENPALAQIRLVQSMPIGSTLELRSDPGVRAT